MPLLNPRDHPSQSHLLNEHHEYLYKFNPVVAETFCLEESGGSVNRASLWGHFSVSFPLNIFFFPPFQMFQWGELLVPQAAGRIPGSSPAWRPSDLAVWSRPSSGPSCPRVWRTPWRPPFPWAPDCLFFVSCREHSCTGDGRWRWVIYYQQCLIYNQ